LNEVKRKEGENSAGLCQFLAEGLRRDLADYHLGEEGTEDRQKIGSGGGGRPGHALSFAILEGGGEGDLENSYPFQQNTINWIGWIVGISGDDAGLAWN